MAVDPTPALAALVTTTALVDGFVQSCQSMVSEPSAGYPPTASPGGRAHRGSAAIWLKGSIAVEWRVIECAPKVKMLNVPDDEPDWYEPDEYYALCGVVATMDPRSHALVMLGAEADLRRTLRLGQRPHPRKHKYTRSCRTSTYPHIPAHRLQTLGSRTSPLPVDAVALLPILDHVIAALCPRRRGGLGRRHCLERRRRPICACRYAGRGRISRNVRSLCAATPEPRHRRKNRCFACASH